MELYEKEKIKEHFFYSFCFTLSREMNILFLANFHKIQNSFSWNIIFDMTIFDTHFNTFLSGKVLSSTPMISDSF